MFNYLSDDLVVFFYHEFCEMSETNSAVCLTRYRVYQNMHRFERNHGVLMWVKLKCLKSLLRSSNSKNDE